MDEPLDTKTGWVDLPLPDAAEVPRDRIALALRYAMHLASRSRRGAELGSATLSCVAHLVGADAGLLARTDTATLVAEAIALLARVGLPGGQAGGAEAARPAVAPTTEPWRRPRRSMRKILADPNPGNEAIRDASSTSADLDAIKSAGANDPLALVGWHVIAVRPDSAMQEADHLDLRPTLGPALAQLARQLLHEAMHTHGVFSPPNSSHNANVASSHAEAAQRDRLLRIGADVVVSIVRRDPADALRDVGRDLMSRPIATTSADSSDVDDAPSDDQEDEFADGQREPDLEDVEGDGLPRDMEGEPAPTTAVEMSVGGHVSQLAVDSASLRAAIIAGTSAEPDAIPQAPNPAAASADAGTTRNNAAGLAAAHGPAWSLLALRGVATDPGTLAVLHAFHRTAVDSGLLVNDRPDLLATLSRGERETVQLLLTGKSETVIASLLRRSPHTVHSHVKRAYRKLGVASRAELMAKLLPG